MRNKLIKAANNSNRFQSGVKELLSSFEESSRCLRGAFIEAEELERIRQVEEKRVLEAEQQRMEAERSRLERQFTND